MIYRWRETARMRGSAQAVGERLAAIADESGGAIRPEAVVDDARQETSALHPYFEWNDAKAADEHRKDQARKLIASVVMIVKEGDHDIEARAFINITEDDDTRNYVTMASAMSDAERRKRVVAKALRELEAWQRRYRMFEELAHIFEAIEKRSTAA